MKSVVQAFCLVVELAWLESLEIAQAPLEVKEVRQESGFESEEVCIEVSEVQLTLCGFEEVEIKCVKLQGEVQ